MKKCFFMHLDNPPSLLTQGNGGFFAVFFFEFTTVSIWFSQVSHDPKHLVRLNAGFQFRFLFCAFVLLLKKKKKNIFNLSYIMPQLISAKRRKANISR